MLAGWSHFSLTTLACSFLFPCSCLAAGDRAKAILWRVLDYYNRYSKDNHRFKNKSNHKNKRPILWGQSHVIGVFLFPLGCRQGCRRCAWLVCKGTAPGIGFEGLQRYCWILMSIWPFPCCICQYLVKDGIEVWCSSCVRLRNSWKFFN